MKLRTRQRVEGAVARALLGLPEAAVRRLAGAPIERGGRRLDPQVQLAMKLSRLARKQPSHALGLRRARVEMEVTTRQMVGESPPLARVEDGTLAGRPIRIYRPLAARRPGPTVLLFHGGGFVLGSLDSHDAPCRELAARTPCTVIAVDYRLAPEHRFPAAADDALLVFRELVTRAEPLGVDRERLAVAGDSAGANLAAVLSLDTRSDAVRPCFQLLVYPVTDMTMSMPSVEEMGHGFYLERETMRWFHETYLGGADPRDPRASPLLAEDLRGAPPALVVTAGFDPLRDEGDAYAVRLREAGVEVAHHQHASLFHGFWNTTAVMVAAERAFDEAVAVLRAALA